MQFTQDFFNPEIRDGFEISAMMKRAWAAQMEVLQVVADICKKNGLQYFADWGTLSSSDETVWRLLAFPAFTGLLLSG